MARNSALETSAKFLSKPLEVMRYLLPYEICAGIYHPNALFSGREVQKGCVSFGAIHKVTTCSKVLNFVHKIFLGIKEEPLLCGVNTK